MKPIFKAVSTLALAAVVSSVCVGANAQGRVFAWGYNAGGELNNGGGTDDATPKPVIGVKGIKAISMGAEHVIALKPNGTVMTWGGNLWGELGNGTAGYGNYAPAKVAGISDVVAVAAGGGGSSIVLKSDGTVWGWGNNDRGQLGQGNYDHFYIPTPVQVPGISDVVKISVGGGSCFAIKSDGTLWCWGSNQWGNLGVGHTVNVIYPTQVPLYNVRLISAGGAHTLASTEDGTIWSWGSNVHGELGYGNKTDSWVPKQVLGITHPTSLSAETDTSLAVVSGIALAWGFGEFGQNGNGSVADTLLPGLVTNLTSGVASVSCGVWHCLAMSTSGQVAAWGDGSHGAIGDKTYNKRLTPVSPFGLPQVVAITAGFYESAALEVMGTNPVSVSVTAAPGQKGKGVLITGRVTTNGFPIAGKQVQFSIDGIPVGTSNKSNSMGLCTYTFSIPQNFSVGAHTITAEFEPDYTYGYASGTGSLTVAKGPSKVDMLCPTGKPGTTVSFVGKLYNSTGGAIKGETLTFKIGSTVVGSSMTDATGMASVTYMIPTNAMKKDYPISATFEGNSELLGKTGTAKLTVK